LRETAGTQGCGAYSQLDVHAPAPDPPVWLYHRFLLSFREVEASWPKPESVLVLAELSAATGAGDGVAGLG
jgi:hypothetical protein